MKSVLRPFLLAVFLFHLSESPTVATADSVSLVADHWCPYNCEPDNKDPGFLIEIAQYGLQKAGHTLNYLVMPWARAIQESREGKYNGVVGAFPNDVPDFIYPKLALGKAVNNFYVTTGNPWRFSGVQSLGAVSIGIIKDYAYSDLMDEYIRKNIKNPSLVQVASGDDALQINFNKLLAKRIDAILEDGSVIEYYLKKNNLSGKVQEAGSLEQQDVFVAFSPANPKSKEYAELVSAGVSELMTNGKMEKIRIKYGLK